MTRKHETKVLFLTYATSNEIVQGVSSCVSDE